MKIIFLLFLCMACHLQAMAQQTNCPQYARLIAEAQKLRTDKKYKDALYKYNAAQAHCPANKTLVQKEIEELLTEIELVKNDAVKAKDQAEKAKDEAKKALKQAKAAQIQAKIALKQAEVAQAEIVRQLVKDVRTEIDKMEDYEWCIATLKNAANLGQEREQVAAAMLEVAFIFAHNDTLRQRSKALADSAVVWTSVGDASVHTDVSASKDSQNNPKARIASVWTEVHTDVSASKDSQNNPKARIASVWTEVHTTVKNQRITLQKYLTEKYFPVFVPIEGGQFTMGSTTDKVFSSKDSLTTRENEKPAHEVQISNFSMATTEVTFAQYSLYANAVKITPRATLSGDYNGTNPVHSVSWYDACRYANWLSEQQGLQAAYRLYAPTDTLKTSPLTTKDDDGTNYIEVFLDSTSKGYRLPTEAEWEYAAKEGKHRSNFTFSGSNDLNEVGWYYSNRKKGETQPVATKKPNRLGLYDMSGNVWEWCEDYWDENFYETCKNQGIVKNPLCKNRANFRLVLRGGSWFSGDGISRVADRDYSIPSIRNYSGGFRLCISQ
jgi:formylglycine-generating enzyme required for sulfatase activity